MKILLASPRGFCAGVTRAVAIVEKSLEKFGAPVYVRHEIVHNECVVESLKRKGAVFVDELKDVPKGGVVIFSAHGVSPSIRREADLLGLISIDATCPLVDKVHQEVRKFHTQGCSVIMVGKKGHQEVIGVQGEAPVQVVSDTEDVAALALKEPVAYVTQTTYSMDDVKELVSLLKKKYPNIISPQKDDVCYATQNRQNAVKLLSKQSDLVLVVGSKTSSNSKRLVETAIKHGSKALLIADASFVTEEMFDGVETLGITSGASVPESLVKEIIEKIGAPVEKLACAEENMKFSLPKEVR